MYRCVCCVCFRRRAFSWRPIMPLSSLEGGGEDEGVYRSIGEVFAKPDEKEPVKVEEFLKRTAK